MQELITNKTPFPTLVVPLGKDGSISHAITIVDDLFIDSTQKHALKLCAESFDWAVGNTCIGIYRAIWFQHPWKQKTSKSAEVFNRECNKNY